MELLNRRTAAEMGGLYEAQSFEDFLQSRTLLLAVSEPDKRFTIGQSIRTPFSPKYPPTYIYIPTVRHLAEQTGGEGLTLQGILPNNSNQESCTVYPASSKDQNDLESIGLKYNFLDLQRTSWDDAVVLKGIRISNMNMRYHLLVAITNPELDKRALDKRAFVHLFYERLQLIYWINTFN